jgi:hypothetical protein
MRRLAATALTLVAAATGVQAAPISIGTIVGADFATSGTLGIAAN